MIHQLNSAEERPVYLESLSKEIRLSSYHKSMSAISPSAENATAQKPDAIAIWHWPLFQTGWKGVCFMLVLICVFLLIHVKTGQTGMASLSVLAILAVTHWFWFPVHYVFNAYGIRRRIMFIPQRFPWARIEGFQSMSDGIRLCRSSPSSNSLRLFFVAWGRHRAEIESIVIHYTRRTPTRKYGSSSVSFRERLM